MSEHDCKHCKEAFTVPFDMEPTDYCNSCAQELLPTALARAESAEKRVAKLAALIWETRWVCEEADYQEMVGLAAEIRSGSFEGLDKKEVK